MKCGYKNVQKKKSKKWIYYKKAEDEKAGEYTQGVNHGFRALLKSLYFNARVI